MQPLRFYISKRFLRTPFIPKPRTVEDRYKSILRAHRDRRLELAEPVPERPHQFRARPKPVEPKILRNDRKLMPLHDEVPPYPKYTVEDVKKYEEHGTYYDPHFNPHLHEGRNEVNPEEEPFNAIYRDSTSGLASEYTRVRNITTPELWEYVERLARIKVAPKPMTRKPGEMIRLPSGYVPPPESPPDLPYFIARTRNYLLPVYYHFDSDPEDCYTEVKGISGDLWQLEQDIREHLEGLQGNKRRILTSVQETDARIHFRGRHLHEVVDWLHQKGF